MAHRSTGVRVGTPHRLRSGILAAGMAGVLAAGLLGFSRATVGHDGLGSVSVLLPAGDAVRDRFCMCPVDEVAAFWSRDRHSGRAHDPVAVAVVFGVEAAHWFDVAHVYVLDGEYADVDTSRKAVLNAVHPIIILVHLLFWLPWPVLGAIVGVGARRRGAPSAPPSS
jgi:hypothetical protein